MAGGGEMGARIRAYNWASTPLGPPEAWPQSLKTCVRIILTSRQPMFVWWGKELINLYNDAYKSIVGGKHPKALGQPASIVWREIWGALQPRVESSMLGNEGTYDEALLLIMERYGYPEETYYTFSYSPVPNDDGSVGGIICANTDDTRTIVGERQVALLRELAACTADAQSAQEACALSAAALGTNSTDLPFALIYLVDAAEHRVLLAGASGFKQSHHPAAPAMASSEQDSVWPFAQAASSHGVVHVTDLQGRFTDLPSGTWDRPPTQAVVVPVAPSGEHGRAGVLIVGLNPYRLFDDSYRGFLDLIAGQISAGIAQAEAYEQEKQRAEALAAIDRAKTAFFSNVSHEFRTPLTLMMAPLEDALRSDDVRLAGPLRESLAVAHRNSQRLLKLVNTLLDFSRIEAGRVQAMYESVPLGTLTAELASAFRSAVDRAGMTLQIDTPDPDRAAFVDRDMWEKIVLNLVSNAFKYTLAGGIQVRLRSTDREAVLTVSDTGAGIPKAAIPHLFERFYRVPNVQGRTHEGTGIGLALVNELVKLHGGSISVQSEVGRGSTFEVRIPLGWEHLPRERVRAESVLTSTTVGANAFVEEALRWLPDHSDAGESGAYESPAGRLPRTAGSILLADDNADMRQYVQRLLRAQGYSVTAVADGAAALDTALADPPDLVLTDVMMPKLDGTALLKALRANASTRLVPVIMLSARAGLEARSEGLEQGADDYLVKPFSARELLARVSATLGAARVRLATQDALREEARTLETLNRVGKAVAAELSLERVVQIVTDAATELSGAAFGSFFYNVKKDGEDSFWLYALSGAPREAFSGFPMVRNTQVFAPTFSGEAVVRSDDITKDPRYGRNAPFRGMPPGHLPVRSYLAVPVTSRTGGVIGGLLFGHPEAGVFNERAERLVVGIASQAAIAVDNARLYEAAQKEIAERARVEAALRKSEHLYRAIGESIDYGIWVCDASGRNSYASDSFLALVGLTQEQCSNFGWRDVLHPDDMERTLAAWEECVAKGAVWDVEHRYRGVDGQYHPVLARGVPVRDERGEIICWVGINLDISRLKHAEDALRDADRRKDQFLALLAHELRNPLAPIRNGLQILSMIGLRDERQQHVHEVIERQVSHLVRLVDDLLDVSRITRGKLELRMERITLDSVIQGALETVRPLIEQSGQQLTVKLPEQPVYLMADAVRLTQVFANLLSNSVKYTPPEGYVRLSAQLIDGSVAVHIEDNGIGIPENALSTVFDMFTQVDRVTDRTSGGLGIGLSVVKSLVEMHHGTVRAESPGPGKGSVFTVCVPLAEGSDMNENGQDLGLKDSTAKRRVLVVDDNVDAAESMAALLSMLGHEIRTANDGEQAVELAQAFEPDLILMDIGMPRMNGLEAARRIRQLPLRKRPKIAALTGWGQDADRRGSSEAGIDRHLVKPVELQTVQQLLEEDTRPT
jgi:PAS domain S-box-containing protein